MECANVVWGLTMALTATTCASSPVGQRPLEAAGATVVLVIGVPQRLPDTSLILTFEAVVEDSRCPTGTNCVWEGDAAVRLRLTTPKTAPASATLHTSQDSARETVYDGLRIKLVTLTPVPAIGAIIRPEDYRVTLLIERK